MKLVSIETIPGQEFEALDIVRGTVVYSKNFGRDFMAGMKTLVGGEITGYTEMLVEARQIATKRMVDAAEALGADAVVGSRCSLTGGRGTCPPCHQTPCWSLPAIAIQTTLIPGFLLWMTVSGMSDSFLARASI